MIPGVKIPDNIQKLDRDDALITFLDTTPAVSSPTWKLLGVGITAYRNILQSTSGNRKVDNREKRKDRPRKQPKAK